MSITKKRRITIIMSIVSISIIIVLALLLTRGGEKANPINRTDKISIDMDIGLTDSLEGMIEHADVIVIGKYEGLSSTFNLARNPQNPSEEASNEYAEGRLFEFRVSEILLGEIDEETILIAHPYSSSYAVKEVMSENGTVLVPATETNTFTFTYLEPLYVEPVVGATYMLFLGNKFDDYGFYMEAIVPGSIMLGDDGAVSIQSGAVIEDNPLFNQEVVASDSRIIEIDIGDISVPDSVRGMTFDEVKAEIFALTGK